MGKNFPPTQWWWAWAETHTWFLHIFCLSKWSHIVGSKAGRETAVITTVCPERQALDWPKSWPSTPHYTRTAFWRSQLYMYFYLFSTQIVPVSSSSTQNLNGWRQKLFDIHWCVILFTWNLRAFSAVFWQMLSTSIPILFLRTGEITTEWLCEFVDPLEPLQNLSPLSLHSHWKINLMAFLLLWYYCQVKFYI